MDCSFYPATCVGSQKKYLQTQHQPGTSLLLFLFFFCLFSSIFFFIFFSSFSSSSLLFRLLLFFFVFFASFSFSLLPFRFSLFVFSLSFRFFLFSVPFAGYDLTLAALSPNPFLRDESLGAVLLILSWIFVAGFFSYTKVCIAVIFRTQGRRGLLWYGAVTQAGSAVGSIIMFVLVNIFQFFMSAPVCSSSQI
ncbi:SLC52A3 [Acanthosepion pharaonis]|uniref:Riboflavin transporter n=1 Tax=Acanthosepion pharaonis TaxID=158019 RepID=A0A812E3T9_ACAPH|nr:SLC52A3 [Sepia pharaonis]